VYIGINQVNKEFFDTIRLEVPGGISRTERVREEALRAGMNFRYRPDGTINIAVDETTEPVDLVEIASAFARALDTRTPPIGPVSAAFEAPFGRTSPFLGHPVFNSYHSETQMMRYVRGLERKDIGLDTSMIPLGSCTMKLNAAAEMLPLTWNEFSAMHPFCPVDQADGYQQMLRELEFALCKITGFDAVSLQPNSGAQGEFTGLLVIRAFHRSRGEHRRDVVLIPDSAHGTNPASSTMAASTSTICGQRPSNIEIALRR
jgi:glycine dehydrogenase